MSITETRPVNPMTGQEIPDDKLHTLANLAKQQVQLEGDIERYEQAIEKLKEKLNYLRDKAIPMTMMEIGMMSFKLQSGAAIEVTKFYVGSLPKADEEPEKRAKAFEWFRENGHGDLIKRTLKAVFGKGDDKRAEKLKLLMLKAGYVAEDRSDVHPQTLKAFIREQVERGIALPTDLLGVYVGNRAKVTMPK